MQHMAYRLMVMGEQCSVHQICRSSIPNVYGCKFPTTFTKFHTYASQSHCELLIPSSFEFNPLSPFHLLPKNWKSFWSPPSLCFNFDPLESCCAFLIFLVIYVVRCWTFGKFMWEQVDPLDGPMVTVVLCCEWSHGNGSFKLWTLEVKTSLFEMLLLMPLSQLLLFSMPFLMMMVLS